MKIRMHFDRYVTRYGRKQLIPVYIEANTYNFYWSKDVISTETNTVNSSRQLGNDCGRALRSYVRRKSWTWIWTQLMMTLNRFKRPVKISKWDTMKTKNHWKQRGSQSKNEFEESLEQSRTWRCRTCCVQKMACCLCRRVEELVTNIELNSWRTRNEKERLPLLFACDYGCMTQENADSLPVLICQDGRYDQTEATYRERKGPAAYSISFHVGSIKGLGFGRVILKCTTNRARSHVKMGDSSMCVSGSVTTEPPEGDHIPNGRVEMAVRESETTMQTSLDYKRTKRKRAHRRWQSATQLASLRFSAQVMNTMRIGHWHQKPTCRHANQGKFHTWRMESSFVFNISHFSFYRLFWNDV